MVRATIRPRQREPKIERVFALGISIFTMVYTRSQKSAAATAAFRVVARYTLDKSGRVNVAVPVTPIAAAAAAAAAVPIKRAVSTVNSPTQRQLWSSWATWYHAFVAEIKDEGAAAGLGNRFLLAEHRWVAFCAKSLRCNEIIVQAWVDSTDAQKRLTAAGF